MASISRPYGDAELRSGGKIVKERRTVAPRTPYERPPQLLLNSRTENPNWLSKLILSPTRMIASGAGKVLSVFRSDSSSSSSSEGDYTSDGDSDDAIDDTIDDTSVSSRDAQDLEKINSVGKGPLAIEWKSETKRAVERILMQETFSREECDRLTHIIKSRVIESPGMGSVDGRLSEMPSRIVGSDDMPDICSTAITEAEQWLEQKKLGSNSKPELEYGICNLNTTVLPLVIDGESGSPVYLAKSYMRERPPWTSPSMNNILSKSQSPIGMRLSKEDTPNVYGGKSGSTSKVMKDSSSIGSWNILEEIRKVRSRATEDMLRTRPSLLIGWSTLVSDTNRSPGSLVADKGESVSQIALDRLLIEASPPDPAAPISSQCQDMAAIQITEEAEGLRDSLAGRLNYGQRLQPSEDMNGDAATDGSIERLNFTVGGNIQDSRLYEINGCTFVEVAVKDSAVAANGFPSSGSSLRAGQGEQKSKILNEQQKLADSGHNNSKASVPVVETCELFSESNLVVPLNDNDNAVSGSQDSSSIQHEELLQDPVPLKSKRKGGKGNNVTPKRRYARKVKGKSK